MQMNHQTLQQMQEINIKEVEKNELVDINEVEIDTKLSVPARVKNYVDTVHNPFLVKVGDYVVKLGYSDCEETLNDRMNQFIAKVAEIKYD